MSTSIDEHIKSETPQDIGSLLALAASSQFLFGNGASSITQDSSALTAALVNNPQQAAVLSSIFSPSLRALSSTVGTNSQQNSPSSNSLLPTETGQRSISLSYGSSRSHLGICVVKVLHVRYSSVYNRLLFFYLCRIAELM